MTKPIALRAPQDPSNPAKVGAFHGQETERAKDGWLCCTNCGVRIAHMSDVLPEQGAPIYANPAGRVFSLLLVRRATNLRELGGATFEFTWFSGYAWRIAECRGCQRHLGWLYRAGQPDVALSGFYGLLRSELCPCS